MNDRPRIQHPGFTLIELMVALTIAALTVTAGYRALSILVDRRDTADAATESTMRAWAIRDAITGWLAGARLDQAGVVAAFRGLDGERDHIPDDDLTFLTTAPTPLGDGDALVHLFVARDAVGKARGLTADFSQWRGTRHATVLLDSAVTSLDIAYRSGVFVAAAWSASWISTSVLPSGVRVTLRGAPRDAIAPLLREPIVVAIEGGR